MTKHVKKIVICQQSLIIILHYLINKSTCGPFIVLMHIDKCTLVRILFKHLVRDQRAKILQKTDQPEDNN